MSQLANNLPDAKTMQEIASTVLSFSCDPEQQYQLVAIALRVLITYTEHNHGMLILQRQVLCISFHRVFVFKNCEKFMMFFGWHIVEQWFSKPGLLGTLRFHK